MIPLRPSMTEKILTSLFLTVSILDSDYHNTIEGFDSPMKTNSLLKSLDCLDGEQLPCLLRAEFIINKDSLPPFEFEPIFWGLDVLTIKKQPVLWVLQTFENGS